MFLFDLDQRRKLASVKGVPNVEIGLDHRWKKTEYGVEFIPNDWNDK